MAYFDYNSVSFKNKDIDKFKGKFGGPGDPKSAGSTKTNIISRNGVESRVDVTRSTNGGALEPYTYKKASIDTTGYSAGKKEFTLKGEYGYGDKSSSPTKVSGYQKTISRNQVPGTLSKIKKQ